MSSIFPGFRERKNGELEIRPVDWLDYLDGARFVHQRLLAELIDAISIIGERFNPKDATSLSIRSAIEKMEMDLDSFPTTEFPDFDAGIQETIEYIKKIH